MAYKLTLSNKNMDLGSQNVVLYGMQNLRNILDDIVVVKGYAQMNRIVENTFEGDDSFGYESIIHEALFANELPLTDECHSVELNITNANAVDLFTFKGEKVPTNIESCKIINKKLKSSYDNMPCPDSVEVAIEAE